jgi:hypothetical protein
MSQILHIHSDSVCPAVSGITVSANRKSISRLDLRYNVEGAITNLQLPRMGTCMRADKLWEHSCFEVFIRVPNQNWYYEFNFAPSRAWAAYRFISHRKGMLIASEIVPPCIETSTNPNHYAISVGLELDSFPELEREPIWEIGLSTVIEEINGRKSYWALAHPEGPADFHHTACFAHDLKIAEIL